MKVLFSCVPGKGHYNPLLPLARAFVRRGDRVAFLTARSMAPDVSIEGFEHLPAGASTDEMFAEAARRSGVDQVAGAVPGAVAEFFAGARLDLGGDAALDLARQWQPDLIVNEMFDLVGVLVATGLTAPLATVSLGPATPPEFLDAIAANAAPRFVARGYEPPIGLPAGRWVLETCPDGLSASRTPTKAERLTLRPEAHRDSAGAAPALPAPVPGRPRVLITLGSQFAASEVVVKLLDDLTGGSEPLDVEFVATILPGADVAGVRHRSEHVTVVPFQPLSRLLTGVTAALIHGGAGTTLGCLAEGVPLVVWPQGLDQPVQAVAVHAAGAGIGLPPGPVSAPVLREAVRQVVTDPAYADAAGRIRREIEAMSAPERVAADLAEALAAS
ncbi:glycosyltransferase family 1 protein [Actinoplanes sp. TBRC 11911]|uniref:glycosyltransferase n=1 Tax=Actinoplanes sp. TBRC 11911 TaxID=2729386 RepID=UPI00145F4C84|nr:glycosyltransferase [Actinoplanes sp. TBRC 11911]NMO53759.1 glycosyltransferase family 1 protein [Actinoplanes sp. TBRC 11911]